MHHKKNRFSFKGLRHFIHDVYEIRSQDPQRQAEAIRKATDDLRQVARQGRDMHVDTFEDFLKDVAEAVRGWPQYSSVDDKKIATGLLALNGLLLPLIYSWGKPNTSSQIIALCVVIINLVFNLCYLAIRHSQEKLNIKATGCLLSLVQLIFTVGTVLVLTAMLWYVFPPAVIVFLLASLAAFLVWYLHMFRDTIIAAHIRRLSPPQGVNVQSSTTLLPPPKEEDN